MCSYNVILKAQIQYKCANSISYYDLHQKGFLDNFRFDIHTKGCQLLREFLGPCAKNSHGPLT